MRSGSSFRNLSLRASFLAALLPVVSCSGVASERLGTQPTGGGSAEVAGAGGQSSGSGGTNVGPGGAGDGVDAGAVGRDGGQGGDSAEPSDPDENALACARSNGALNAGVTPARRLTRDQFNSTVRDLLGIDGRPADALAPDERIGPFQSNAVAPITDLLVQQHQEVAVALAKLAEPRMNELSPCNLVADTGTTCATQFVTELVGRAYRRPLQTSEVQTYVSLFALGRQEAPSVGFRLVVEAMLQSPFFLYHHDVGASGVPQPGAVPVTPHELASRLSYFLWNSMPDKELTSLAGNGTLTTRAVLTQQVERMVSDPKAAETIALFHTQWLGLDDLVGRDKSATLYPRYDQQVGSDMLRETRLFADSVVRGGDGLLRTLLTSPVVFPQGELFNIYGLTQAADFVAGSPVAADPARRAGILTQAAFLTRQAHADQSSPVHRGIIIRENLLCETIPPPPGNVNTTPPTPTPITSTRQRFAQHEADPTCAACHRLMDPIGLAFEHYDAIGSYRDMDGLGPVDARGEIMVVPATSSLAGAFAGAVELSAKLAGSRQVSDCFANQWFRYSMGRMESVDDACSIQAIHDGFHTSAGNIRSLLANIALSPAFLNVRTNGG
jgi:hypothetical protein